MEIPLYSSTIRRSEMDAVLTCMVEEKVGPGEIAEKLEKKVKEIFNVAGAVALRSPAIALSYALEMLELPKGAKVMVSALAPAWQYIQIQKDGYLPLILDVDAKTALVSPNVVEQGIKDGGRVLLLHETLGFLPNMDVILDFQIPIIEDISQSAGASLIEKPGEKEIERKAGTFGVFSILGMEESDILTSGGGAILIAPEKRNSFVLKKMYESSASTDRLPDINAALGFVQLKQMSKNMEIRKEINKAFSKSLMSSKHEGFSLYEKAINPVYSFPVLLNRGFKDVEKYANRQKIEIQPAFSGSIAQLIGDEIEKYISANSLFLRTALFPLYPRLGAKKAEVISKVLLTLP